MSWSVFKKKRNRILTFLNRKLNKTKVEAFYDEDFKEVKKFQEAVDFLKAFDMNKYLDTGICPICGSKDWFTGYAEDMKYSCANNENLDGEADLVVHKCEECGFYCVEDW